jgi:hypothetical protein
MNLLVISRGKNKIPKSRSLHSCLELLLSQAIFNEFKVNLLGGKECSWICTLVYNEFMNLLPIY